MKADAVSVCLGKAPPLAGLFSSHVRGGGNGDPDPQPPAIGLHRPKPPPGGDAWETRLSPVCVEQVPLPFIYRFNVVRFAENPDNLFSGRLEVPFAMHHINCLEQAGHVQFA